MKAVNKNRTTSLARATFFSCGFLLFYTTWGIGQKTNSELVYDRVNRLFQIRYSDRIVQYIYDAAGNRTGMTVEVLVAVPVVTSINPRGAVVGGPGSVLRILGSNFSSSSVVKWNGVDRATSFVGATELQITLTSDDLAVAGTASMVVVNPSPTLAPSNSATFSIVQQAAIGGRITSNGNGLAGVDVALSGTETGSTVTDANGFYNFAVLLNGNYTLTPSKASYIFDPASRNISYSGLSESDLNFTGTLNAAPVNIFGRVLGYDGRGNHSAVGVNFQFARATVDREGEPAGVFSLLRASPRTCLHYSSRIERKSPILSKDNSGKRRRDRARDRGRSIA